MLSLSRGAVSNFARVATAQPSVVAAAAVTLQQRLANVLPAVQDFVSQQLLLLDQQQQQQPSPALQPLYIPLTTNHSRHHHHHHHHQHHCNLGNRYFSTTASSSSSSSSSSSPRRPFCILGIQQIAIGCETRDPLKRLWQDVFGLEPSSTHTMPTENVQEDIVPLPQFVELDLMVPLDPNASPKVHIPPLNHIGLWVDDLHKAVEWMTAQGVRFTPGGIRRGAAGHDVTFIHPKANDAFPIAGNGVLIELVQAPPEIITTLLQQQQQQQQQQLEGREEEKKKENE